MKVRPVRIAALIFSTLPAKYGAHNLSVIDNIFDALIAFLCAFAQLLD